MVRRGDGILLFFNAARLICLQRDKKGVTIWRVVPSTHANLSRGLGGQRYPVQGSGVQNCLLSRGGVTERKVAAGM